MRADLAIPNGLRFYCLEEIEQLRVCVSCGAADCLSVARAFEPRATCLSCHALFRLYIPFDEHPGHLIRRSVVLSGLTVTAAAQRLGVTRQALNNVLNCRSAISPAMALRFEQAGWRTADFWVHLQARYDLVQVRRRAHVPPTVADRQRVPCF